MNKDLKIGAFALLAISGYYLFKKLSPGVGIEYKFSNLGVTWNGLTPALKISVRIKNNNTSSSLNISKLSGDLYLGQYHLGVLNSTSSVNILPGGYQDLPLRVDIDYGSLGGNFTNLLKTALQEGVAVKLNGTIIANGVSLPFIKTLTFGS